MKRKIQKTLAFLLLLSLVVTLLPNTVFAEENQETKESTNEDIEKTDTPEADTQSTNEPTAKDQVLKATEGTNHEVTMSIYLLYSNTLPTDENGNLDLNKPFDAGLFGPSGNDHPYFTVTVNVETLLGKTGMDAIYHEDGRWYISLATCTGVAGTTWNDKLTTFWNNVLACMSVEDQNKFKDNFGGNYRGYVVKQETGTHIDGILLQDPDVYLTEVFGPDDDHSLIASHSETNKKTTIATVIGDVQTYYRSTLGDEKLVASLKEISEDGKTIQVLLKNNSIGDSNYGLEYLVTLTGTPLVIASPFKNQSVPDYVKMTDHFFQANYTITSIEQKTVRITLTKVWDDENDKARKREKACPIWIKVKTNTTEDSIQFSAKRGWTSTLVVPVSTEDDFYQVTEYYHSYENPSTAAGNDYASSVEIVKPILEKGLVVNQPSITVTNTCITNTGKLTVTKTFEGLDTSAIATLKENGFAIVLTGDKVKTPVSLTLDKATVDKDTNTYTWTLDAIPTGTYKITEENPDVTGYSKTQTASVNGKTETTLSDAAVTIWYQSEDNTLEVRNIYSKDETESTPGTDTPSTPDIDKPVIDVPPTDVPSTDTPTTDTPESGEDTDTPGTDDDTNIDDPSTPTTDKPETGDDTTIDDGKTPITNSDAPKTGDPFVIWSILAAASATGLTGYVVKKKKDQNDK